MINTALFGLKPKGSTIEILFNNTIGKKANFHPFKLSDIVTAQKLPLIVYPYAYFDSAWGIVERASPLKNLPFNWCVMIFFII